MAMQTDTDGITPARVHFRRWQNGLFTNCAKWRAEVGFLKLVPVDNTTDLGIRIPVLTPTVGQSRMAN